MLRKIFLAIVLVVILSSCLAVADMQHPTQAPVISFSTPDEATPDEATADGATPLEVQSSTAVSTEKATENATESQTEAYIEPPTEAEEYIEYIAPTEAEPEYDDDVESDDAETAYSSSDREWIARVICMEAGNCSEECQWLVGSTALNLADRYNGGNIEATVTDPNIFAVAGYFYLREPSVQNWAVADRVLSGDRDYQVMAFRTDYYHSFGTPYTVVDNVYFSTY